LEGDPQAVAKKAREEGIRLYTIGIGTREGELIQIVNAKGAREFLKDNDGNFVKSKLNESLLKKIALLTEGAYARAGAARFGLEVLYDQYISKLEKIEFERAQEKRYHERFQIPLLLGLILLVIESCLSSNKRS
jgi:Ca-activated chloride channel family protein